MGPSNLSLPRLLCLIVCFLFASGTALAQSSVPSRIVEQVNDRALVTLRRNTHPLAQAQFDQGAAPPDLPMSRMLLVLKRSDAQEAALEKLLDDQQDQNSPSYHQWLTPDQFGQQFGPSDQDMQTIAAWLRSHGFQVAPISHGRTVMEFSGTAAQVLQAFHTEIHKYLLNGEEHWANASDPQIPAALAPVVEGINSLHNFPKRPLYHIVGRFSKERNSGRVTSLGSEFTTADTNLCPGTGDCYFVGPYDFATIYNVLPLWNATPALDGTGQSIAIADESNINLQDVRDFRNLFGLAANDPQVFVDGIDPGLVQGAETEALLDVEWAGAVAKGAAVKLVVSAPTNSTQGADLSTVYAIENSLAPVISESFGTCELFLGTAGNSFENAIRQQASAQGITFITSAGDSGAAACDGFSGNTPEPAMLGLAVNGLASSPYGVALGGTDFLNYGSNYNFKVPSPYWSTTNNTNQASALGYVPETTWNDSCTNNIFVFLGAGSTPEASCNNSQLTAGVLTVGGGGGKSNCITSNGTSPSNCLNGYPKPAWQSAPGVPADGVRDIPDVSLFASNGFMSSAYIVCEADMFPGHGSCSLSQPNFTFLGIGGTSASAPAFAGMMALVNQFTNSSGQGNANYVLYKLASSSAQTSQNCNATSNPAGGCIFHDVTSGTIAQPCAKSSPNCNFSNGSDTYGVLSGYSATAGYDLATGLGSVNANNLVHNWIRPTNSSSTSLTLNGGQPVSVTHGQAVSFTIGVTPAAATGAVSLVGTPTGSQSVSMASFPLQSGTATGSTTALAGGSSYQVKAHYGGDGVYAPSDSSPVTVTVAAEPSKTLITIPLYDPNTGNETSNTPASVAYGTPIGVRVDVGNAGAKTSLPPQLVCAVLACPTGSVTVTDSLNGGAPGPLSGASAFTLNNGGYAESDGLSLLGGTHQISASYPGDNSYLKSTGNYSLTVTPAAMQLSFLAIPAIAPIVGMPVNMYATFNAANSFPGAGPTGTITFYDGTTQIPGTVTYSNGQSGGSNFPASLTGYITAAFATLGTHQVTAKYSGDSNYAPASGSAMTLSAVYATTAVATANPAQVNLGQSLNVTVTVTGASKTPPMTGTFSFSTMPNAVTPTVGTDASGNQTLTATVVVTPQTSQAIYVNYSGDTNYEAAQITTSVIVNIPDFSLNFPSSPLLISAGQPGSVVVTVVPASNMTSTVSLSCEGNFGGGPPGGYTCAFSPAAVNLSNGAAATSTLTISPVAQASVARAKRGITTKPDGLIADHSSRLRGFILFSGLLALTLLICPMKWPYQRMRTGVFVVGVICLAVGCGGGSSGGGATSGGGGGGGGGTSPTPQPTSITVSASAAKVPDATPVSYMATVQGSNHPTGTVLFYLNGIFSGSANLVGNTAVASGETPFIGAYVLTAQYTGDPLNSPSTSAGVNLAITGSSYIGIQGNTSTDVHFYELNYTLQ